MSKLTFLTESIETGSCLSEFSKMLKVNVVSFALLQLRFIICQYYFENYYCSPDFCYFFLFFVTICTHRRIIFQQPVNIIDNRILHSIYVMFKNILFTFSFEISLTKEIYNTNKKIPTNNVLMVVKTFCLSWIFSIIDLVK